MHSKLAYLAYLLLFLPLFPSCGRKPLEESPCVAVELQAVDTLIAPGSSGCVSITDVSCSDGICYVLDGPRSEIRAFDEEGNLQRVFGSTGCGPGEMSWPVSLCSAGDTLIFVSDYSGLLEFSSSGVWNGRPLEYSSNPMLNLQSLNDVSIVTYRHNLFVLNERATLGWIIASYSRGGSVQTVFLHDTVSIENSDATELLNCSALAFRFACGGDRFFSYDRNQKYYQIVCSNSSGSWLYQISQPTTIVQKNQVELDRESSEIEDWLSGLGSSNVIEYVYNPRPWREPVKDMWVTEDGTQLWVQRGDLDGFQFDIYSAVDGSLLETAEAQLDTTGLWQVDFFVADSSRVYAILETRDFEQLLVQFSSSS
jgi:hypothetical protein